MNNQDGLDEMQRERHNRIGNQMFTVMMLAFLVNVTLYGLGVHWLDHPMDTMVIVTACSGVYLVRVILAGAYQQPRKPKRKVTIVIVILVTVLAGVMAMSLRRLPVDVSEEANDYAAYILMGVSVTGLLGAGIASVIRRRLDGEES